MTLSAAIDRVEARAAEIKIELRYSDGAALKEAIEALAKER